MKKALVIGAGIAGSAAAFELGSIGFKVTVLEAGQNPGGGVWTKYCGGHPYTLGPRVFFTRNEDVIKHLTSKIKIRHFITKTMTFVESEERMFNYPLQSEDLPSFRDARRIESELGALKNSLPSTEDFESYWRSSIGDTLYQLFVDKYSKKMWGIESNRQLSANFSWVNRGTPIRHGDTRLYEDMFQGYPEDLDGFNTYFQKCLSNVTVHYGVRVSRFDPDKKEVRLEDGTPLEADVVINTGHVDDLFGVTYGRLKYCGRDFFPIWLPVEYALPEDITWIHYSSDEPYTRVTEFKKITGFKSRSTILGIEIPSERGRYYPVQCGPEMTRFDKYKKLFPENFFSIGRLGKFQYQGIPEAIEDALALRELLK